MILEHGQAKVYLVTGYTNMRKAIGGLSLMVQAQMDMDPAIPGGFLSRLMEGVSYPLFRKVFITPRNLRLYKLKVSDMLAGCPRKHRSQPRLESESMSAPML